MRTVSKGEVDKLKGDLAALDTPEFRSKLGSLKQVFAQSFRIVRHEWHLIET